MACAPRIEPERLVRDIRDWADELGFDGVGITGCELADDERRLTLTIVRELGNQGRWRVARLEAATPKHHGASVFTLADAPALEAGPSVEGKVRVSSHFNIPVRLDDQTVRLEVDADLPAIACGSLAPSDAPASHPDLTLAIAEEAIPIHGAVYRRDAKTGQHRIVLATSPLDCSEQLGETEVGVTLVLDRIGRSVESVALGGLRLDDRPTTPLGKSPIRTSLRGLGKSVRVTFDGAAEVAGLDLALSGQATATYCR